MLQAFTRNYEDNSTDAGFQFTFYCDLCQDGFKTSFIPASSYKKKKTLRGLASAANALGSVIGGAASRVGYGLGSGGDILSERFEGMSPEWQKEHERAFQLAQNEAQQHFHRCHNCRLWVCDADFNEEDGLCVECAPRENIAVAKARADAMLRNMEEKAATATVWKGDLERKTTVCPQCGKAAGAGKFCNNCGASMETNKCPQCGTAMAQGARFCNNCGANMAATGCPGCGAKLEPGVKFCGECGTKI